jgi:hypothetical protein
MELAFRMSVYRGDLNKVKRLVESGVNIRSCHDVPIRWAMHYNHLNILRYFIEDQKVECNLYRYLNERVCRPNRSIVEMVQQKLIQYSGLNDVLPTEIRLKIGEYI